MNKKIDIKINAEEIFLSIEHAVPCGLMLNEILINSIKYAFSKKWRGKPEINICIKEKNSFVEIKCFDNGIGFKVDMDLNKFDTLGVSLINLLVIQLNGEIDIGFRKWVKVCYKISEKRKLGYFLLPTSIKKC